LSSYVQTHTDKQG